MSVVVKVAGAVPAHTAQAWGCCIWVITVFTMNIILKRCYSLTSKEHTQVNRRQAWRKYESKMFVQYRKVLNAKTSEKTVWYESFIKLQSPLRLILSGRWKQPQSLMCSVRLSAQDQDLIISLAPDKKPCPRGYDFIIHFFNNNNSWLISLSPSYDFMTCLWRAVTDRSLRWASVVFQVVVRW